MPDTAPIDTRHPQYPQFAPRWRLVADVLDGEDTVQRAAERYLAPPGGVLPKTDDERARFGIYRERARLPSVTEQALTGLVGLAFESEPDGAAPDVPITDTGRSNVELAREVLRAVIARGRDVLVIDAPTAGQGGGVPFITRYPAEALINWRTVPGQPAALALAVFEERVPDDPDDLYGHATRVQYRRYQLDPVLGRVEVTVWSAPEEGTGEARRIGSTEYLPLDALPILVPGAIDLEPPCDPVPLLPVARCALAYYRKSATYEHGLYLTGQPTPWVTGVDEAQYELIATQGIGSNSLWPLPEGAAVGFLETSGVGFEALAAAMREELVQAEAHAVRLTQPGRALRPRCAR